MRLKQLLFSAVAALVLTFPAYASVNPRTSAYKQAVNLYENGMYERARAIFETMPGDPMTDGYSVLCALKMRSADAGRAYDTYRVQYGTSSLEPLMNLQNALNLFDEKDYARAASEFDRLDIDAVPEISRSEAIFKHGFSWYSLDRFPEARSCFSDLERRPACDYTSNARYLNGYMDYLDGSFASAASWFRKAQSDPRFEEMSKFYVVDCEFNLRNYDYVLNEGVAMYETVPAERQSRLARMISESYLVKGDKASAREYYDNSYREDMSRSDYFYAGSVLYAVDDFQGAIDSFTKMTDRTDSLGQIANYQLGNAYIHTRNNVAAMDAFKDASVLSYDPLIQEDACFNYAKLAFDLNKDTSGFADYIKRYSTRAKGDQIYSYMALAALYNRDYVGAVEAYDNIDELAPDMKSNYTKANFLRGEQLLRSGSYRDAIPCLRAAAYYLPRTDRLNQFSRYWMGECQYNTGDYEAAKDTFTDLYNSSALQGQDEGNLLPYNVGYCYYRLGNYPQAARWFDVYCDSRNKLYREDALTRRADCDFARKDYKSAIASYDLVSAEFGSPDNIYPYYQRALAYGLTGNKADKQKKVEVLSQVENATPSSPMYDEAMYELARSYVEIKDSKNAIRVFNKLRSSTKDNTYVARALIGLGMVNRNEKAYEKALEYYKEVVSMMPGSEYAEDSMLAIESIYQSMKQPQKYLDYVEQNSLLARKSAADKEQIYFNTAEQVYLGGNSQQALVSLQKFLDEFPESDKAAQAYFYMAESHKSLGNKEKACDAYERVCELATEGSFAESARLGYADMCYSLERFQDAYVGYRNLLSAAKIDINKASARTGMMRSAFMGRDYESAVDAAAAVKADLKCPAALRREADFVTAKSYLATSRRAEALKLFSDLALSPSTPEGAEAKYILIQNLYDTADFDKVEKAVYEFSSGAGDQSYWLAKAYIVLGDSFLERGMESQAVATFESIRDGYEPTSSTDDVLDNVKIRLQRIQNK